MKRRIRIWRIVYLVGILPLFTGIGYALGLLRRDALTVSQILIIVFIVVLAVLWRMLDRQIKRWEKALELQEWRIHESRLKYPVSFHAVEVVEYLDSMRFKRLVNSYMAFHEVHGDVYFYIHYTNSRAVEIVAEQEGDFFEMAEDECMEILVNGDASITNDFAFDMIGTISKAEFYKYLERAQSASSSLYSSSGAVVSS